MIIYKIIYGWYRKLYVFYVLNFARGKLKKSLSERRERYPSEYCLTCGECCKNCVNFKNHKCNIWGQQDYRCTAFPMFRYQLDIRPKIKEKCRYYWED